MPSPDFLKKLQESLQKGEKTEVTEYINQIDKLASTIGLQEAAERLDKRIATVEVQKEMTEEDRKLVEEELAKLNVEQKENDEKLKFLAAIQQMTADIKKLKIEYEATKFGYETKIDKLREDKVTLMTKFEVKYGTRAEDAYNTELGTDIKIE